MADTPGRLNAPWPAERWPTPAEWAAWVVTLPPEQLEQVAARVIWNAQVSARCIEQGHDQPLDIPPTHDHDKETQTP